MPVHEDPEAIPGFAESASTDLLMAEELNPENLPTHVPTSGLNLEDFPVKSRRNYVGFTVI